MRDYCALSVMRFASVECYFVNSFFILVTYLKVKESDISNYLFFLRIYDCREIRFLYNHEIFKLGEYYNFRSQKEGSFNRF